MSFKASGKNNRDQTENVIKLRICNDKKSDNLYSNDLEVITSKEYLRPRWISINCKHFLQSHISVASIYRTTTKCQQKISQ